MSDETTLNVKGIEQLLKAMQKSKAVARVGILGSKNIRQDENGKEVGSAGGKSVNVNAKKPLKGSKGSNQSLSNAEIGAVHEFGTTSQPQRSFLRVPISEHFKDKVADSKIAERERLAEVIATGELTPWVKELAVIGEAIVAEAFATGGFGKWPAWKTPGYRNNTGQLLKNTQQLSQSITSEVVE